MMIELLRNKFVGFFGIIMSVLVFNLGIALPIYSLSLLKVNQGIVLINQTSDEMDSYADNAERLPIEEEEETDTPTPGAEEEDEKPKETFEPWKFVGSKSQSGKSIIKKSRLQNRLYEVSTPPPEVQPMA